MKKRFVIISLAIVAAVALCCGLIVMARYVITNTSHDSVVTKSFTFESDFLKEETTPPTYYLTYDYDGASNQGISFEIYNHKKDADGKNFSVSETDIDFKVEYKQGDGEYTQFGEKLVIEGNNANTTAVHIPATNFGFENGQAEVDVRVTTSNTYYEKVLSAKFVISIPQNTGLLTVDDTSGSNIATVRVDVNSMYGEVTILCPDGYMPNPLDVSSEKGIKIETNDAGKKYFVIENAPQWSSYTLTFLKNNSGATTKEFSAHRTNDPYAVEYSKNP